MRNRVLLFATLLWAGAACRSLGPELVRVEMPGVSPFPPGSFSEIIVTDFRNEAPLPDFDAGRELRTFLESELRHAFDGTVAVLPLPAGAVVSPESWKDAAAGRSRAVFLTGTVRLAGQVRKAVGGRKVPVDSPFNVTGRALVEQIRWTLSVDLEIISAETGEALYSNTFREDRDYGELDKPAEFAFSDLSSGFRARLFPILLGSPTFEQRMLFRR